MEASQVTLDGDEEAYKDRDTLVKLYNNGLTQAEIGDKLGVATGTISRWFDKHNIDTGYGESDGRDYKNGNVDCIHCGEPIGANNTQCGECLDKLREADRNATA